MLVRWLGGKSKLAEQIIGTFPPHKRYIEPFFGGGWVYFKKQSAEESIINDINSDLVNLYCVVRDFPQELARLIHYTPFTEGYYNQVMDLYWNHRDIWNKQTPVLKAFGYYLLIKCSFNSMGQSFAVNPGGQSNWLGRGILETIEAVSEKLQQNTVILNRDYKQILADYGTNQTLVYLDPPYAVTITQASTYYEYRLTEKQHEELRETLIGAIFKWVLSYDIHPFVTKLYSGLPGVHIFETSKMFQSSANRNKLKYDDAPDESRFKHEYLITNFDIQESLPLFYHET